MSLIERLFGKKPSSASIARDRLQIIITQERSNRNASRVPDYLPTLQKEVLEVLSKYVSIKLEDINISHEKHDGVDMLALNITLPDNRLPESKPADTKNGPTDESAS